MPRKKSLTSKKQITKEDEKIKKLEISEVKSDEEKEIGKKGKLYYEGVGCRKTVTARIRLYTRNKEILINGKDYKIYFPLKHWQAVIESPFEKMKCFGKFGLTAQVKGGGLFAQAEAVRMGIARALISFNPDFKRRLRRAGYLTRDSRMVERKKFGLKKARRAPQWSKR